MAVTVRGASPIGSRSAWLSAWELGLWSLGFDAWSFVPWFPPPQVGGYAVAALPKPVLVIARPSAHTARVKLFYTGPAESAELLVVMLGKHGIEAKRELAGEADPDDPDDLNRQANVFVPEADYALAHRLFYTDREDEL